MSKTVYINGQFVEASDAKVSVYDGGFLHAAGLFETMSARNGCVFRLDAHLQRLLRSAAKLLLPIDPEALPSADAFAELLERNERPAARVRLTVTAGSMQQDGQTAPQPTICATVGDAAMYAPTLYEQGVKAVVCDFRLSPSDPTAGHKTTGYLPRLLALRAAQQTRCFEAIWFTTGNHLAEGSISNVFLVDGGVLKTPPLDTPVLPGIARGVVIEMAQALEIEVHEAPLTINDLLDADEVLLTNAVMQAMPVIGIENHTIAEGHVGPLARTLLTEYQARMKKECSRS